MMVYDGKTLQITERKEIIYSNYRFQGIKIKEKKVSIFRNENDIYTISPLFHHLEQMKE